MSAAARTADRPPLSSQVAWTATGNVVYAALQWGMLIALTKLVRPEGVGKFGLGLAISVPVLMFTNLQLRSIQATRASDRFGFRDYLGLRVVSTGLGVLCIGLAVAAIGYPIPTSLTVLAVSLAKGIEAISDTTYGHLQRYERMDRIAISMSLKGMLSFLMLAGAIALTRSVLFGALGMGLGSLIILLAYDLPQAGRTSLQSGEATSLAEAVRPRFARDSGVSIARLGLPLGIASLLLALAANIPRYFLERLHGEAALGYFAALSLPTAAFSIIVSAFGQAASPRLAEYFRNDRSAFWRTVLALCAVPILVASGATAAVALLGPRLLQILYRAEYARYFDEFLILLATGAVWSLASVLGFSVTAARRLTGQAPVSFGVCIAALVLSYALIPGQGLRGACLVSLVSGGASLISYLGLLVWRPVRLEAPSAVSG